MDAVEIYREFSNNDPSIPLFSRAWWLDAAAGAGKWNVALVQKDGQVMAAMPYVVYRRFGMTVISHPPLTPRLGPWFRDMPGKPATKLAREKEAMQAMIDQLPDFDHFIQSWHYGRTNWLPFSWNGFQQTTRYTYLLTDLSDTKKLWADFDNTTRANCKKAEERFKLQIRDDLPIDDFLALNRMTYARQGMDVPYSDAYVRRLDAACVERGCRKLYIAVDPEGRHHAGNYVVWDENSAYGLMNAGDPALRNSGATTLCLWIGIKHAATVTKRFDFAGSMLEQIERFVRGFGPVQVPYFSIRKTPSRLLRTRQAVLSVVKGGYGSRSVST